MVVRHAMRRRQTPNKFYYKTFRTALFREIKREWSKWVSEIEKSWINPPNQHLGIETSQLFLRWKRNLRSPFVTGGVSALWTAIINILAWRGGVHQSRGGGIAARSGRIDPGLMKNNVTDKPIYIFILRCLLSWVCSLVSGGGKNISPNRMIDVENVQRVFTLKPCALRIMVGRWLGTKRRTRAGVGLCQRNHMWGRAFV